MRRALARSALRLRQSLARRAIYAPVQASKETTMWRTPKPPKLLQEVLAEFELQGPDTVRSLLASSSDGVSGTSRNTPVRIGNAVAKRGEMQDWLNWKAAVKDATETRRFHTNVWLVVAGIVAAFLIAAWQSGWFK
jgi:hypothetical protein